jgi:hypothetical protein
MEAVKRSILGSPLQYASEELKCDREFVLEAVKEYGRVLKCVIEGCSGDKKSLMEAVKKDKGPLHYASEELKGDCAFVLEAMRIMETSFSQL